MASVIGFLSLIFTFNWPIGLCYFILIEDSKVSVGIIFIYFSITAVLCLLSAKAFSLNTNSDKSASQDPSNRAFLPLSQSQTSNFYFSLSKCCTYTQSILFLNEI